jgi:hypothetical protein
MRRVRWKAGSKATEKARAASVQDMPEKPATLSIPNCGRVEKHFQIRRVTGGLVVASALFLLQVLTAAPRASAAGLQSNAAAPAAQVETPSPAISDSLRPALAQVGHSVGQIQIDHWKVSKNWKEQLQSDADSITGDLSHQLPGLLQQAQATPAALDVQLRVMQNVDALYDVLVRLTLAADMTEKKSDAALLDSALQQLEAARKVATAQLVTAAAQQHQQLSDLQARMEAIQASHPVSAMHGKTIVVDNEVRHDKPHHPTHHKKPSPSTSIKSQPNPAPSTGDKPSPQ